MHLPQRSVLVLAAVLLLGAGSAASQPYPAKPVRIVTSGVGGGADTVLRVLAQPLSANLGQQVLIDNRGSGIVTPEIYFKMPADGYSYMLYNNTVWVGPLLEKATYEPLRDFAPVTLVTQSPNIVVVHPAMPVKTMKDLVALAKSRAGQVNYASGGSGSSNHMAAELFQAMAKVKLTRVPYKSGSQQATDLLSGYVQLMFASASMTPYIKSGRLRAVAVGSAQPSALFPGVPTVASQGLPGYESGSYYAIFAHAKTPEPMVTKIYQEAVRYIKTPDAKEKYLNAGMEAIGSTPAELATLIKTDYARQAKLIKEANITVSE